MRDIILQRVKHGIDENMTVDVIAVGGRKLIPVHWDWEMHAVIHNDSNIFPLTEIHVFYLWPGKTGKRDARSSATPVPNIPYLG